MSDAWIVPLAFLAGLLTGLTITEVFDQTPPNPDPDPRYVIESI